MITMMPFGTTQEQVDKNLQTLESMLEQNEQCRKAEDERWEKLSPQEKQAEKESPALEVGFKKCQRCGMIPQLWWSLAEGYGLEPFVWAFDEQTKRKAQDAEASGNCRNHMDKEYLDKIWDARFKSIADARDFWNELTRTSESAPTQKPVNG